MRYPSLVGLDKLDITFPNPDYSELLANRRKFLKKLDNNPSKIPLVMKFYSKHPISFIQDLLFTYDPRLKGNKRIPFVLFQRQAEYIEFLVDVFEDRDDAIIEKCRDVGASWLNVAFTVWLFIFKPEASILWGANRMSLIDQLGDMNALLERIDFTLKTIIAPLRPRYTRNWGKLINQDNYAQITGAGGKNIGRGGRETITFIDEAAFIENMDKVEASLSMNTDCQIWLSTPNGQNVFYRKRMGGVFKVFTFQWYEDPRKDQAWYDLQKSKLEPHVFAQEVLIDYNASIENQMIKPMWINSAIRIDLEATGLKSLGYDVADEGADKFAQVGRHGSRVLFAEDWDELETHGASTRKVWVKATTEKYRAINYDNIGVGAGAKVEFEHLTKDIPLDVYSIAVTGISMGEGASDEEFEDTGKNCKDMFNGLKAESWWKLRRRFQKTHEHYEGLAVHPADEMICLKDIGHGDLADELSSPKFFINENGKIGVESKKSMQARSIKSPNLADALVLAYAKGEDFDYSGLL